MLKYVIIFFVSHNVINGVLGQVTVDKQYPHWLVQLGIREISKDLVTKKLNYDDTLTKGCDVAVRNNIQSSGNQLESAHSKFIERSGLPLIELGNGLYYFGTYLKTNFFKAMQFCRDHGMNLLSIETREENTEIINYISTKLGSIDHFWTSGSDLGEEGHFVWLATGKSLNFTYWSPPQPDNAGNIENCLEIWKLGDKHYIWNDIPCGNAYNFICEVKKCSEFCIN